MDDRAATFTGERISDRDLDFRPDASQHLAAYQACLPFIRDGVVLDGGCGEGHGARYLAASARLVVGVDRSWESVRGALRGGARNVVFSRSDLGSLPFRDGSFDVVCSFQVLEHLRQPVPLLREAVRVLRPSGLAILTTPNRLTSFSENPYHVREYEPAELRELIAPLFASVTLLGIFGNDRVRQLQSSRRRHVERILSLDPIRLRRLLPESVRKWAFARLARFVRRRMRADHGAAFSELDPSDFTVRANGLEESIDLLAICRK
jgi:SAM-dependent methyltransferase